MDGTPKDEKPAETGTRVPEKTDEGGDSVSTMTVRLIPNNYIQDFS